MSEDAIVAPSEAFALDRLQDVLRSSPDGACELMLHALGFDAPAARIRRLRDQRRLDIASSTCPSAYHEGRVPMHHRWTWRWRPRARQLELGAMTSSTTSVSANERAT